MSTPARLHRYRIGVFMTRPSEYEGLRASLRDAGFTEQECHFTVFDNSSANMHDPYLEIPRLIAAAGQSYVVVCHQDVRFDLGHGREQLSTVLEELDHEHPRWMVAGNAGMDAVATAHLHLNDPWGAFRAGSLPQRVISLDENFLVFKARSGLKFTDGLSGFHFYATDACLNAGLQGGSAHVVDFLLTHLSTGDKGSEYFQRCYQAFANAWRKKVWVGLIRTPCTEFRLSRFRVIQRFLRFNPVARLLRRLDCALVPR